jgi:hypothetical protein
MVCRTVDREAFDHGQRAWSGLCGRPGFLGQCGGWSRRDGRLAHIFGCWADMPSYRAFMGEAHDGLAGTQYGTYDSIEVRLFDHRLDIGAGFAAGDVHATLLRLAHCHVRADRRAHFAQAQAEVWNPGMSTAPGMLGGTFAQRADGEFLVLSRWGSEADHDSYVHDRFLDLRGRSGAAEDLDTVAGDLVDVEPAWTLLR